MKITYTEEWKKKTRVDSRNEVVCPYCNLNLVETYAKEEKSIYLHKGTLGFECKGCSKTFHVKVETKKTYTTFIKKGVRKSFREESKAVVTGSYEDAKKYINRIIAWGNNDSGMRRNYAINSPLDKTINKLMSSLKEGGDLNTKEYYELIKAFKDNSVADWERGQTNA